MALYDSTRLAAVSRGALRPGRPVARLLGAFHAWKDRHATRKVLARLSAHELADIGLDQGDIDAAADGRRQPR